jgi:hypothetical protein
VGARLVSLALARWTHVSDRAFRLLVRMALTALDESSKGAPAGIYFGGRDLLAMTLRNEGGNPQTRYRAVKRLLAELIEAGAIERAHAGRVGQNAVYRLTLDGARSIDKAPSADRNQGGQESPPQGGQGGPPEGGLGDPSRGATEAPPRNHEEPVEELLEEKEKLDLHTAVTVTPLAEAAEDPISIPDEVVAPVLRLVTDDRPAVGSRRWSSRGQDAIAEAMARRAAARERHQQEAGETA